MLGVKIADNLRWIFLRYRGEKKVDTFADNIISKILKCLAKDL